MRALALQGVAPFAAYPPLARGLPPSPNLWKNLAYGRRPYGRRFASPADLWYAVGMDEIFPIRTLGRAPNPPTATIVRELTRGDLEALGDEKGAKPTALKRISERHHALARTLAGGMAPGQAAIICGYEPSRVSILMGDPAFKELLNFYREDVNSQYRDLHQRLSGLALDAAEILADRLEDTPEDLSVGQLMEITKMGADRTGYGPQSSTTQLNVNVNLASRLEAARKRVADRKLIEGN